MNAITVNHLTFSYRDNDSFSLRNVSFTVSKGEIILIIGESGCGKTTLLKHLKPAFVPDGIRNDDWEILYHGVKAEQLSEKEQAFSVGYVGQQVEASQVTDKVWHELAFGLESLSWTQERMQLRVAEMTAFFGLESVFHKRLSDLSGGQKQLVNLASVMAMEPELLILDEPTSQLDPKSASEFFRMIRKIHDEIGTTIVMTEHRLEEIFPMASRVMVLEAGRVIRLGTAEDVCGFLYREGMSLFRAMPTAARLYYGLGYGKAGYFDENEESQNATGRNFNTAGGIENGCDEHGTPCDCEKLWFVDAKDKCSDACSAPLTVSEGRVWLERCMEHEALVCSVGETVLMQKECGSRDNSFVPNDPGKQGKPSMLQALGKQGKTFAPRESWKQMKDPVLQADELWFRYEKDGADVLKACSIDLYKGRITAVLGGNGAGKSTLLHVLAGQLTPYLGRVKNAGASIGVLPQNPQVMFAGKTVAEELGLTHIICNQNIAKTDIGMSKLLDFFDLRDCLKQHPFDLSGGQMEKLALCKLAAADYDILLLDEPGKGMDYAFKEKLGIYLREMVSRGKTIFLVSHDVEFTAKYADTCGMFFDGHIVSLTDARSFFLNNMFYTTAVRRMCRGLLDAVIVEDVLDFFGAAKGIGVHVGNGDCSSFEMGWEGSYTVAAGDCPGKTGGYDLEGSGQKVIAPVVDDCRGKTGSFDTESGEEKMIASVVDDCQNKTGVSDLEYGKKRSSADIDQNEKTDLGKERHSDKRKLTADKKQFMISCLVFFLVMPLTIYVGHSVLHQRKYYFIALMLILEGIGAFLFGYEGRKPDLKEIMTVAVMGAITALVRALFYMIPAVKPTAALTIISGIGLGSTCGFLVGAMSMLVSDIFFGQGPWAPWQMFTMGLLGFLAGIIFKQDFHVDGRRRWRISLYGLLSVFFIYGGIMNPASEWMFQEYVNFDMILAAYIRGIPIDLIHAVSTFVFLWFGAAPMLEKLERVKRK